MFLSSLHDLVEYRDLLWTLTWRDIKVRYKQSLMGFMWAILMPTLIVGAGIVVRLAFSLNSGRTLNMSDIASVALKSLPWAFVVGAVKFATNSLVTNAPLVTKIYFPREVFPLASVLASLFDFLIAAVVVIVFLGYARVGISLELIWVPVLLILLVLMTTGASIFLACANLFYRDVKYIVDVLLTFGVLFTPVFYEAEMLGKWQPLILLNPVAVILEGLNDAVIHHRAPDPGWMLYAALMSTVGLYLSWVVFDRSEAMFAERV